MWDQCVIWVIWLLDYSVYLRYSYQHSLEKEKLHRWLLTVFQVLHSLFGSRLSTLILATPTFDDITEGSAGQLTKASTTPSAVLPVSHALAKRVDSRTEAVPQFFLNFLRRQTKMRRWSRKSMMGGRGCFGMKMDRIGSMSGLGC